MRRPQWLKQLLACVGLWLYTHTHTQPLWSGGDRNRTHVLCLCRAREASCGPTRSGPTQSGPSRPLKPLCSNFRAAGAEITVILGTAGVSQTSFRFLPLSRSLARSHFAVYCWRSVSLLGSRSALETQAGRFLPGRSRA